VYAAAEVSGQLRSFRVYRSAIILSSAIILLLFFFFLTSWSLALDVFLSAAFFLHLAIGCRFLFYQLAVLWYVQE
jgi:hypothetical protein